MQEIRLTNSATHRKEVFRPIDPANVRMYVCGPTVYDRAHLGNARPVVVFDVLFRLLRQVYGAERVTYVRNFTDVDDKINAAAQARKAAGDPRPLEELIRERTEETIGWYHADMDALGALRPTHEPRATDYISRMIAMIEGLIASGHAYAKDGHVLFRVRSDAGLWPAVGPVGGRHDRRGAGRGGAVQGRPAGFRAVEALGRRPAGLGQPLGAGAAGLAYRVLGDVRMRCWGRVSTFTAAGWICSFRTMRTSWRRAGARIPRRGLPITGCTTRCCRSRGRRCPRAWATSSPCGICWRQGQPHPGRGDPVGVPGHALPEADGLDGGEGGTGGGDVAEVAWVGGRCQDRARRCPASSRRLPTI